MSALGKRKSDGVLGGASEEKKSKSAPEYVPRGGRKEPDALSDEERIALAADARGHQLNVDQQSSPFVNRGSPRASPLQAPSSCPSSPASYAGTEPPKLSV